MPNYLYKQNTVTRLGDSVPGSPVVLSTGPEHQVLVQAAAQYKADLDDAMLLRGYSYVSQDPVQTAQQAATATLIFGTTAGTVCEGSDARLSDDRVGSALRNATGTVDVSAADAPTAGQVLTAVDGNSASWQTAAVGLPASGEVTGATSITTTSTSAVLMSGMTVTPPAGTYLVWFTGDFAQTTGSALTGTMAIFVAGNLVTASERSCGDSVTAAKEPFCCVARVTVTGAQAIEGRWRTTNGTIQNTRRTLTYLRVA